MGKNFGLLPPKGVQKNGKYLWFLPWNELPGNELKVPFENNGLKKVKPTLIQSKVGKFFRFPPFFLLFLNQPKPWLIKLDPLPFPFGKR